MLSTPEGVDRALAKLDTIKDQVVWWSAGAETPQLLADKEVVMGSTYNGRLFSVIEEQKQPVAMLWDWQVFDFDGWIVPADLPEDRMNRVMHFLNFATDTQRLADQAKYISYGPARASSQPLVGKHADLGIDMAPHMPTNPDEPEELPGQQHRVVGRQPGRGRGQVPGLADASDALTIGDRGRAGPGPPTTEGTMTDATAGPARGRRGPDARRRRPAAQGEPRAARSGRRSCGR